MKWQEFKARLQMGLQRFMYGRNGVDQFTLFILIASVAVLFSQDFQVSPAQLVYYAG